MSMVSDHLKRTACNTNHFSAQTTHLFLIKVYNVIMQKTGQDQRGQQREDLRFDCDPRPMNSIWREDAEPPVADQQRPIPVAEGGLPKSTTEPAWTGEAMM